MRHELYRHFDSDGTLLYVGTSISTLGRLYSHSSSGWFHKIATITINRFRTKRAALRAESAAVKSERPIHNKYLAARTVGKRIRIPNVVRALFKSLPCTVVLEPDVLEMFQRCKADGYTSKWILENSLREWLTKKGYARKKELQAA